MNLLEQVQSVTSREEKLEVIVRYLANDLHNYNQRDCLDGYFNYLEEDNNLNDTLREVGIDDITFETAGEGGD